VPVLFDQFLMLFFMDQVGLLNVRESERRGGRETAVDSGRA
jgi:hypothetical protein